jgi:hypothetical protein
MSKNTIIGSLAVLVVGVSLFFLLHKPREKSAQLAVDMNAALGQRAAEEVAQLLGNHGQIAVMSLELAPGQNSPDAAQMAAFSQTLKQHGIKIAATKTLSGDDMNILMVGGGVSPKKYVELRAQASGAGAIVSFVGPPSLSVGDLQKLQAQGPPLVVVNTLGGTPGLGSDLAALVEAKAVALAFVPRTAAEMEKEKSQPKIFDRYYKILRAE